MIPNTVILELESIANSKIEKDQISLDRIMELYDLIEKSNSSMTIEELKNKKKYNKIKDIIHNYLSEHKKKRKAQQGLRAYPKTIFL